MKKETKQKIEEILTEELKDYVNSYEINNTISKMDTGFDSSSKVDKTKLELAINNGISYLNSICLPSHVVAMQAIYRNKVFIALGMVNKEFS